MTAPNPAGVRRCIREAIDDAGVTAGEIDLVNGHLTATGADPREVENWSVALERGPDEFPLINSTKSMIGHGLGAAGALESVACLLMLRGGYVHPSINCEDVHPEIEPFAGSIPHQARDMPELSTIIKSGFGFGDVNACLVFRKWADALNTV
jgi:3-oxoacyl-(acyl-carrier-protein) synthase